MNILVTGGAGYIGSAVAHRLKNHFGANVSILDDLSNGSEQAANLTGAKFYIGDISEYRVVSRIIQEQKIDICIHCAASIDATESVKRPYKYFRNNVYGTVEFVQTLLENGVTKIIFSSSTLATVDHNPYGWTKQAGEKILEQEREANNLSYINLRFENVAGATEGFSQWHRYTQTHLIPNIMDVAYGDKESLDVYGNGDANRDYVHIEDIVYAHERAVSMLYNFTPALTFVLGSGTTHSILDVVRVASQITDRRIPIVFENPRKDNVPANRGLSSQLDMQRYLYYAERELLWKPKKNLSDIIKSAWEWKKAHPKGY